MLDHVRTCEVASFDRGVKEVRRRLAAPDADTPGSDAHTGIERFATVTTRLYYQKVTSIPAFGRVDTCRQEAQGAGHWSLRAVSLGAQQLSPLAWYVHACSIRLLRLF